MTSLLTGVLGLGPAGIVTAHVPDLHHFRGSFGGKDVIPLWRDRDATQPNVTAGFLSILSDRIGRVITAEELFCYSYGVLSAPGYVKSFSEELTIPGPRIPITADAALFDRAVQLGSELIWLHTFGERSLVTQRAPEISSGEAQAVTAVPGDSAGYPAKASFDADTKTLRVGKGAFAPVDRTVWEFSVSGFEPVQSWIAHRLAEGAGRRSSELDKIGPRVWTAHMSEELLRLLWIVERTLGMSQDLDQCLTDILKAGMVRSEEMPKPADIERRPLLTTGTRKSDTGQS
jgi:hypothetical protein